MEGGGTSIRSWVGEMVTYTEGEEVGIGDLEWAALSPQVGNVLEVFMAASSFLNPTETWSAFLITSVTTERDGSFFFGVQFLGSEDQDTGTTLAARMGAGGAVHLCLGTPCIEPRPLGEALHATRVRLWQWSTVEVSCGYLIDGAAGKVKKWLKEVADAKKAELGPKAKTRTSKPRATKPTAEKGTGGRGKKAPAKTGLTPGLTDEMKKRLKSKLGEVKRRVHGAKDEDGQMVPEVTEIMDDSDRESSSGPVPTSPEGEVAKLTAGTGLDTTPGGLAVAVPSKDRHGRKRDTADTSGHSSKSLTSQLILQAVDMNRKRRSGTEKEKKHKKTKESEVSKLLAQILTKGTKESSKKKKKKRKSEKKKRKVVDGVIVSCSSSSRSTSAMSSASNSDTDMETPMKKKSRDKPGSVLSLLTEHVREQMDQAALNDVPRSGSSSHQRHQDPQLLLDAHQTSVSGLHAGVERDAYLGGYTGPPPLGGHCPSGGQPECKVHGDTSKYDRSELGGKVHGVAQHGRRQCGVSISGIGVKKTLAGTIGETERHDSKGKEREITKVLVEMARAKKEKGNVSRAKTVKFGRGK